MMETRSDNTMAVILTLGLHAGLLLLIVLASLFSLPRETESAAGEPIQATLAFSASDVRKAQQAIKSSPAAKPAQVEETPAPQPLPSPAPEDSDTPVQPTPQVPQDQPDTVDQEAITRNAILKAEQDAKEQEERTRQAQVDLTEDIVRQQEAERKQRLREQLEAIRRERDVAERRTLMEEQRMQQLADAKPTRATSASPTPPSPQAGNRGEDTGLKARYIAALYATTRANWNSSLATENVRCSVMFTQVPGGEVINVEFRQCAYDAQGRESVERAMRKSPMPYSGFESVFERNITLTLCYPEEACLR
jgi:colicin import membrane protein